jgi:hypothetical protein
MYDDYDHDHLDLHPSHHTVYQTEDHGEILGDPYPTHHVYGRSAKYGFDTAPLETKAAYSYHYDYSHDQDHHTPDVHYD